ncbi:multidrug MFS transporter [Weissella confusa]|uniref:Sugar transferase n=2 Tax=Weissella TaxID=46255 RepID=A0AAJ2YZL9_WEICO|nr:MULTISPECIES: sugar transferase [Weissella]MBD5833682.1 sugar transferase [Weissella confusa]MBJ7688372.1 sugar transferase [Weissella confusa]MBJ7694927.1 sugar transferase [Weissella confusa]MCW0927642.1 sugar transferase [Weissella sp. LMG 11983]MDF9300095.1 sugar transferase [Weissella sp. BK2]
MTKQSKSYLFAKRFLDISTALFALVIFSPIFLVISLFYLFGDNKGPVFYQQRRIGQNHEEFGIYKFRSMVVNAEEKLYADKDLYAKFVENGYKLPTEEDPRITKFGAFIRKTSLDELPQFINILIGNMSIIGPRPVVERELVEYGDRVDEFLSVKPGAMGLWQASGRSDIQYPERADLEISYVEHANLWFDFKILFMTVLAIFKGDGAM